VPLERREALGTLQRSPSCGCSRVKLCSLLQIHVKKFSALGDRVHRFLRVEIAGELPGAPARGRAATCVRTRGARRRQAQGHHRASKAAALPVCVVWNLVSLSLRGRPPCRRDHTSRNAGASAAKPTRSHPHLPGAAQHRVRRPPVVRVSSPAERQGGDQCAVSSGGEKAIPRSAKREGKARGALHNRLPKKSPVPGPSRPRG
jgi:hypothetical protein